MRDADCTALLQWALPQLGMRWAGFRKVRGQVCKRLKRRMGELGLDDFAAYRARLEADPSEWRAFDECCHITISRFFRDRRVFEVLRDQLLPELAQRAKGEARDLRCWSAGCASGEEPYTVRLLWDLQAGRSCPGVSLSIVATDVDEAMLARARDGRFEATSLRELPSELLDGAFDRVGNSFCIRAEHRAGIDFISQDLRLASPPGRFDLILCRYVAFTYFAPLLQQQVLARIAEKLLPRGYLVIGTHEQLPAGAEWLTPLRAAPQILVAERPPDSESR